MSEIASYNKYWGKARRREGVPAASISTGGDGVADSEVWDYHMLVYHCLDVAAVGRVNIC